MKRIRQSTVEASEWFAALRAGELSRAERGRFVDWLRESPAHVEEYLEHASLWEDMGHVGESIDVDLDALLAEVDNIVPLPDREAVDPPTAKKRGSRKQAPEKQGRFTLMSLASAAGLVAVVALGWWIGLDRQPNDVVTTAIGEQRSLTLDDGSVVSLNTQTSVRVNLSATERRVDLLRGEALFDITRDEDRPFIVLAGETEVRVLGTTFNVYRRNEETATVTVLEGRVAIMHSEADDAAVSASSGVAMDPVASSRPDGAMPRIELIEGQQVSIKNTGDTIAPQAANLEKAVAWTERRLIFEGTALADVVAEFNRYNTRQLRVDDPTLAAVRLNAVFEAHDPDSLLEYLRRSKGVRVRDLGDQRILLPRQL